MANIKEIKLFATFIILLIFDPSVAQVFYRVVAGDGMHPT